MISSNTTTTTLLAREDLSGGLASPDGPLPFDVYRLIEVAVPRYRTFISRELRHSTIAPIFSDDIYQRALTQLLIDPDLTVAEATALAGTLLTCSPRLSARLLASHILPRPPALPTWLSLTDIDPEYLFACIPLGNLDDLFFKAIDQLSPSCPMDIAAVRLLAVHVPPLERITHAHEWSDRGLVPAAFTPEALDYLINSAPLTASILALFTELDDAAFTRLLARLDPSRADIAGLLNPHVTTPARLRIMLAHLPSGFQFPYVYAWLRNVLLTEDLVRLLYPFLSTALLCEYIFQTIISNLPCAPPYPSSRLVTELAIQHDLVPADYSSIALEHLPDWYLARLLRSLPGLAYFVLSHDLPIGRIRYRNALERLFVVTRTDRAAVLALLTNPAVSLGQALDATARLDTVV